MSTPRVNEAFTLAEPDYRYGRGPILARVVDVVGRVEYDDEPWWAVLADIAPGTPANHGGWSRHRIYLREAAITHSRTMPQC